MSTTTEPPFDDRHTWSCGVYGADSGVCDCGRDAALFARIAALEAAGDHLANAGGHARLCAVAERPLVATCDCGWEDARAAWERERRATRASD